MALLRNKHILWALFLCGSLALVCLPRFNRQDVAVGVLTSSGQPAYQVNIDSSAYVMLTLFFRNQAAEKQLRSPYTYRPLVPFLASLLPFDPMTAINLVNVAALLAALFFLYKILARLELSYSLRLVGCGLFVFSFPTFYYGAIGYVDPVLIAFLMIGLYCILTERWAILAFIFAAGILVKETMFVLLPVLAAYLVQKRESWKKQLALMSFFCLVFLAISYSTRVLSPDKRQFVWLPSFGGLLFNAARPRCWISCILSFGVPGFLSLVIFLQGRGQAAWKIFKMKLNPGEVELLPFVVGFLTTVAVFVYSMFSVYLDGRYIWISYPFSIPLAAVVLGQLRSKLLVSANAVK